MPNYTSIPRLTSALDHLAENNGARDYEVWNKVGRALRVAEAAGEIPEGEGFRLFSEFSQKCSAKYPGEKELRKTYDGFLGKGKVTLGTVFYLAKNTGWVAPKYKPGEGLNLDWYYSAEEIDRVMETTPYLSKKGTWAPEGARVSKDTLFVPYENLKTGEISAVQTYKADGSKSLLTGSTWDGCAARIGDETATSTNIVCLGEGIATVGAVAEACFAERDRRNPQSKFEGDFNDPQWQAAYAEWQATYAEWQAREELLGPPPAFLAAGAGSNIPKAVAAIREVNLTAEIVILVDRDAEAKAERWAQEFNAKLAKVPADVLPELPNADFWDLWHAQGNEAVSKALAVAKYPAPTEAGQEAQLPGLELLQADMRRILSTPAPPYNFLIDPLLLCAPALIAGPGAAGKTYLQAQLGVSVTTGRGWCEGTSTDRHGNLLSLGIPPRPGAALMVTCEDDTDEIHRRIQAIVQAGNYTPAERRLIEERLVVVSLAHLSSTLLVSEKFQPTKLLNEVERLAEGIPDLRVVMLDPLANLHPADENTADMSHVMGVFLALQARLKCALVLSHHTNKGSLKADDRDQSAFRGHSSIINRPRQGFLLFPMTAAEAKKWNVPDDMRARYVCLRAAKFNQGEWPKGAWLYRGQGGVLTRVAEPEQHVRDNKTFFDILQKVQAEAATGNFFSERKFSEKFCGTGGPFGAGEKKVREWVDDAIVKGFLEVVTPAEAAGRGYTVPATLRKVLLPAPEQAGA